MKDMTLAINNYDSVENTTFLGDYIFKTRRAACDIWPVDPMNDLTQDGVASDVPTLIISGGLDPALPPKTGALILEGLAKGQQIVIPYMGHMMADLSHLACYDDCVLTFFNGGDDQLETSCFEDMKPKPFVIASK